MNAIIDTAASAERAYLQRLRALASTRVSTQVLDSALALGVFAVSFIVYIATLAPGLAYATLDSLEEATVPYQLALMHSPGYPFYTWIGKLFTFLPIGDVAYRMNLLSAVGAAGGCALLYAIVVLLTRNRLAALFVALFYAFSADLWSQAVIAEVYGPNTFMLALTFFLFLAWGERVRHRLGTQEQDARSTLLFASACLVFGLSLGTHLSNLALIPGVAVYIFLLRKLRPLRRRDLLIGGGLFALAACQYLWLLLRASTLNDELMLRYKPTNLWMTYNYMANVFHNDRFVFPIQALPGRVSIYAGLVNHNFGVWGAALAVIGVWAMFRRHRAAFCLLAVTYLVEMIYFLEYNVTDSYLFYLSSHLILAVWIAFGVCSLLAAARTLAPRPLVLRGLVILSSCAIFALPLSIQVVGNWSANDHTGDTTIKDFYNQVFKTVPENSVILGHRGIPGYDLFYSYLMSSRTDVAVPQMKSPYGFAPGLEGRPLFLTLSPDLLRSASMSSEDKDLLPDNLWYVPVIASPSPFQSWLGGHPHILYSAQTEPPPLLVDDPSPQHLVGKEMDGVSLLGYDIDNTQVTPGGTLHIKLYWQVLKPPALSDYKVSLTLGEDDRFREIHTLGFGLIQRYQKDKTLPTDATIVEDYNLVVMSGLSDGKHELRLATSDFGPLGSGTEEAVDLGPITVTKR